MKCIIFTAHDSRAHKVTGTKQILIGPYPCDGLYGPASGVGRQGPAPVDLGSAAHFTILAGATITTTGGGIINGDVGASPITGAAIHLTQAQVNGTIYAVDAAGPADSVIAPALLTTAKGDLTTAFNDAAGRMPAPTGAFLNPELVPGSGNFGGMTLVPGLYKFTGTAAASGADVTLTGGPDDVWIFQIAADLQVGTSVHFILAGGAQARNIFWQVGTSAVIGTFAVFKGTILAGQSITMNTTSAMDGRALAFTAGVTFNGNVGELPTPTAPDICQHLQNDHQLRGRPQHHAIFSRHVANQPKPVPPELDDDRHEHPGHQPVDVHRRQRHGNCDTMLLPGIHHHPKIDSRTRLNSWAQSRVTPHREVPAG